MSQTRSGASYNTINVFCMAASQRQSWHYGASRVLGEGCHNRSESAENACGAVAGVVGNWGGVVSGLFNEP